MTNTFKKHKFSWIALGSLLVVMLVFISYSVANSQKKVLKIEVTAADFNDATNKANDYISLGTLSTDVELISAQMIRQEKFTSNSSRYNIGYLVNGVQQDILPYTSVGNNSQRPVVRTAYTSQSDPVTITATSTVEVVLYKHTQLGGTTFDYRDDFSETTETTGKLFILLHWIDNS